MKPVCNKFFADGKDITEHIFAIDEMFKRLKNAGQTLAESLQVAMTSRSLWSSYDILTIAPESRSDANLTLKLVQLLNEVMKQQNASGNDQVLKVTVARSLMNRHRQVRIPVEVLSVSD